MAIPVTFRADIEGLRAVAVLLVVAQHAWGVPSGGWIGVDVFFVISGFLITRGLIAELERSGRIDYPAFIARRARRILPAAMVVIIVTTIAAAALWYRPRAVGVVLDAIASVFSVQNWHLIAEGASYFQHDGPVSPLQHFWSLAVEEQFYAVWPVVLLVSGLLWLRRTTARRMVAVLALLICIVSIAWAVLRADASGVYFDPLGRAWELAAGALAAAVPLRLRPRAATTVWWLGLVIILVSAVVVPAVVDSPFPAVVPAVVGAVLITATGARAARAAMRPLTVAPVRAVGRISYSLYLWHFPCIVFAASIAPGNGLALAAAVAASTVLAWASHRWIERVFIASSRSRRRRAAPSRGRSRARLVAALAVSPLVVGAALAQSSVPVLTDAEAAATRTGIVSERVSAEPVRFDALRDALQQAEVGGGGVLDGSFTNQFAPEMSSTTGCRNELGTPADRVRVCTDESAGAGRTALVIGDSIAMSWMPAVRQALLPVGWNVRAVGFASCAPADAGRTPSVVGDHLCEDAREEMLAEVERTRPDLLVIANDSQAFTRTIETDLTTAADDWTTSTQRLLKRVSDQADRVVLVGAPPRGPNPTACATRLTGAADCTSSPTREESAFIAANHAAAATVATAESVDVTDWFCVDGNCPITADGVLVRVDDRHLTNAYSERLGLVMRDALTRGENESTAVL